MNLLRSLALSLCLAATLALGGCYATQATQVRANSCETGCNDAVDACINSCIGQMGAGSKETCEQNCGQQRQSCVANCVNH